MVNYFLFSLDFVKCFWVLDNHLVNKERKKKKARKGSDDPSPSKERVFFSGILQNPMSRKISWPRTSPPSSQAWFLILSPVPRVSQARYVHPENLAWQISKWTKWLNLLQMGGSNIQIGKKRTFETNLAARGGGVQYTLTQSTSECQLHELAQEDCWLSIGAII